MSIERAILKKLSLTRVEEKVNYTNPKIDSTTKNIQICVTFSPYDKIPDYSHCKEIATKRVQRHNPSLKCTSYQPNIRKFKSGRVGWIFYFSSENQ